MTPTTLTSGTRLGLFEIISSLGEGGMVSTPVGDWRELTPAWALGGLSTRLLMLRH